MERKQSERIQTSILNPAEKKALVWLAERQPKWMTSNYLTIIGVFGAFLIGLGYALTSRGLGWLWLANFGFLVNWYGDSLDGSLARVRKTQRPIYGFYLDHSVDMINEAMMFIGVGMSPLLDMRIALGILAVYLALTASVSVNAHLRGEFRLTYGKLGPTEFRIIAVIVNICFTYINALSRFSVRFSALGRQFSLGAFDIAALIILIVLVIMFLSSFFGDLKYYAKVDPVKKQENNN
jgi:phosphatidylglycerophosphate synthase